MFSSSTGTSKVSMVVGVGSLVDVSRSDSQSHGDTMVSSRLSGSANKEGVGAEVASPLVRFVIKGVKLDATCIHDVELICLPPFSTSRNASREYLNRSHQPLLLKGFFRQPCQESSKRERQRHTANPTSRPQESRLGVLIERWRWKQDLPERSREKKATVAAPFSILVCFPFQQLNSPRRTKETSKSEELNSRRRTKEIRKSESYVWRIFPKRDQV
ncbi:hypothetical protein VNO80_02831 [Phaseolus coccineus]|uniref:Uncharacterized protein n=1 Tax=Phaseolus coccineus TaxID=3886 RepID=A0AAN9RLW1_PHACN